MEGKMFLRLWDESWDQGIWFGPWTKATQDLTPRQAAWKPDAERHSIWQTVNHVCIWREYTLTKVSGRAGPSHAEVQAANWEEPSAVTDENWRVTLARLKRTHDDMRAVFADPAVTSDRPPYHLVHDSYHMGQIMQLRAMQGLKPIE